MTQMSAELTTLAAAAVTAVGASVGTLALVPKLLKGEIVFKRELEDAKAAFQEALSEQRKRHDEVLGIKNEQISELKETVEQLTLEIRQQNQEDLSRVKEFINAIEFLRSLTHARIDRRS